MSTPPDVALVNEAGVRTKRQVLDLLSVLVPLNLGAQGQTYGTDTMPREDRILAFMQDAKSGALDFFFTVNQQAAEDYVRAFVKDVLASPVMRAGPAGQLVGQIMRGIGNG